MICSHFRLKVINVLMLGVFVADPVVDIILIYNESKKVNNMLQSCFGRSVSLLVNIKI